MFKTGLVIVIVSVLSGAAIAAIVALENRAGSSDDARVQVAALSAQFDRIQALPWKTDSLGRPKASNVAALAAARRTFDASLHQLLRSSPPRPLRDVQAAWLSNYSELVRIDRIGAKNGWSRQRAATLFLVQERSHAKAAAFLIEAGAIYDNRASSAQFDVKAGSAGAIGLLLGAFALFFGRWAHVARSRERVLRIVDEKSEELRHQALHDGLTGLPNRLLILDRAQQMLARARRRGITSAALFIDLDGFKSINDTFGHPAGDSLLRAVAERISLVMRESDTVGRLGGDEFVVLTESGEFDVGPELVAERLLEVLREPFEIDPASNTKVPLSASIGIAIGDRPGADELLRDADVALYEAKGSGKDRAVTFRQEMQLAVQDRLSLEMDLRDALATDGLSLAYQPTFRLADGTAIGFEALLRWDHPTRGRLEPSEIIPIAEQSKLIADIGRWVLSVACAQAAAWHAQGHPVQMAVNVSARQLDEPGFERIVEEALHASGLEPGFLTLEITETTIMRDPQTIAARLSEIKELGVRIAIDDFGTGYSSLAYLQQFPIDMLKIDRSFISGMTASREAKVLVHSLVQLGKNLRIDTVAEGIEDSSQLEQLQSEACELGQGFLLARPFEPDAATEFLDSRFPSQRSKAVEAVR